MTLAVVSHPSKQGNMYRVPATRFRAGTVALQYLALFEQACSVAPQSALTNSQICPLAS